MTAESKWQEPKKDDVEGIDVSDEEKAFTSLSQMKLKELRNLHIKEFGVDTRSKDRNHIARKIAKALVSKSNNTSTSATGLTPQEAVAIVQEAREVYFSVDALKEEKKTRLASLREKLSGLDKQMTEVMQDTNSDAIDRVSKLEVIWAQTKKTEAKKTEQSKEFTQRIRDATTKFRDTMTNLKQIRLPFQP